ncbi:MAG: response regulator [Saprospiraceae bacterium]|nr:response regulator [Saprospiraceae bacterium]
MIQDRYGFMWFGTNNGLNRFDSYDFKVFQNRLDDSSSISSNQINDLDERPNGDIWIATDGGGVNLFHRRQECFTALRNDPNDHNSVASNFISCIVEDSYGYLWIGTEGQGLDVYSVEDRKFDHYTTATSATLRDNHIQCIFEDDKRQIWIGTKSGQLYKFDRDKNSFRKYRIFKEDQITELSSGIRTIFQDQDLKLWIGTSGEGVFTYDLSSNAFKPFSDKLDLSNKTIYAICQDIEDNIWIGTENGGVTVYNTEKEHLTIYKRDELDRFSVSSNSIHSILLDQKGNIWLGTFNAGVDLVSVDAKMFTHYRRKSDEGNLNHNKVLTIYEDSKQFIWIGTDGGGLNRLDPELHEFSSFIHSKGDLNSICGNHVLSICEMENGELWVGTWGAGITVFDSDRKVKGHYRSNEGQGSLSSNNIWKIYQDKRENIWIGTHGGGLNLYDSQQNSFKKVPLVASGQIGSANKILSIMDDRRGLIWIGTEGGGLIRLNPHSGMIKAFEQKDGAHSISHNSVGFVHEDKEGNLWIGTKNGLDYFDVEDQKFSNYSVEDGLQGNQVHGILEDREGMLWISSNGGISKYNTSSDTFENFSADGGVLDSEFKELAFCQTRLGKMYFGGNHGLIGFWPERIRAIEFTPPLIITRFQIFNQELSPDFQGSDKPTLAENISLTDDIILSSESSLVTIDFASVNYVPNSNKQYECRLLGFEEDWRQVGNLHSITYPNLDPGQYTFQVKGTNNDGTWNEAATELGLFIKPPWWETWWFRLLFSFFFVGSIILFLNRRAKSITKKQQSLKMEVALRTQELVVSSFKEKSAREEAEKARIEAEQANAAKSVFLATMSHEIRTPMNGVIGMANLLMETELTVEQQSYAETITISAESLLSVINDVLDFSKIESGRMTLEMDDFELRNCIEDVLDIFANQASQKGIDLIYEIDAEVPAQIIGDHMRLRQILINLINNAVKFTKEGEIFVKVELEKRFAGDIVDLKFQVRDTGIGIPEKKQSKLFRAFSQVDSSVTRKYGGSGLGLVICRRLVEMMGGQIGIESEENVGSNFYFTIKSQAGKQSHPTYVTKLIDAIKGKRILVVDDNETNLKILKTQLEQWGCEVFLASSAASAIKEFSSVPRIDMILTDMQMPGMDGTALAKSIKDLQEDIPIILLTSLGDTSYKENADLFSAVLIKPVKHHRLQKIIQEQLRRPNRSLGKSEDKKERMSTDFAKRHPARILVAEDNLINQVVIRKILNRMGFDPIIVENGREALRALEEDQFDIVLMDVQMPEMDGLEATKQIRERFGGYPFIIAMTANAMQSDKEACLAAGMDDYLSKPVMIDELISKLEKWTSEVEI